MPEASHHEAPTRPVNIAKPVLADALGLSPRDVDECDHPDPRPCPAWCWVLLDDDFTHQIEGPNPGDAAHRLDHSPAVPTVCYSGRPHHDAQIFTLATIESSLEQRGGCLPVIKVALRSYPWKKGVGHQQDFSERLRMTTAEARELARALDYLADVGDGKREPLDVQDD